MDECERERERELERERERVRESWLTESRVIGGVRCAEAECGGRVWRWRRRQRAEVACGDSVRR